MSGSRYALTMLIALFSASAIGADSGLTPRYTIAKQEINSFKNDVYYRVSIVREGRIPTIEEVNRICKELDNENRRKFGALIYLKGMDINDIAYASCGRLPNSGKLEYKILGLPYKIKK